MSRGSKWEAAIAAENQMLYAQGRAMVARVPTHYHGGIASNDPKVDFVGVIFGGRMVAIEAKSGAGVLKATQRAYLHTVTRMGGLAFVYRHVDGERHLCLVDEDGQMERKSEVTKARAATWLDAAQARGFV